MAYNGRRAPVSQYRDLGIHHLNEIPTEQDLNGLDAYDMESELALFTNTQFYDFDLGSSEFGVSSHGQMGGDTIAPSAVDIKAVDGLGDFGQGDFNFPEYSNFAQPQSYVRDGLPEVTPIQTQSIYGASTASSPTPISAVSPVVGEKRVASTPAGENYEDTSRVAAEEDKRRRNTAASARFRVKKKQREQALERSAKEMADKVAAFESRINTLEMENKWLKNLITEKNENKEDITLLYKKYVSEQDRKGSERKDGVGTKA